MKRILLIILAIVPFVLTAQVKKLGKKSTSTDVKAYAEAKAKEGAVDEAMKVLDEYAPKMKTDLDRAVLKTTKGMILRDLEKYEEEQVVMLEGIELLKSAIANGSYDKKKYTATDIEPSIASYQVELSAISLSLDSLDLAEKYSKEALEFYKAHVEEQPAYNYYISTCQVYLARVALAKGMSALAVMYNADAYSTLATYTKMFPTQGDNAVLVSNLLYSMTDVYREVGNYSNAIELINKGIRLAVPGHVVSFYDQLGNIYLKMNNFTAAKGAYDKIIELDPEFYEKNFNSDLRFIFYHPAAK